MLLLNREVKKKNVYFLNHISNNSVKKIKIPMSVLNTLPLVRVVLQIG